MLCRELTCPDGPLDWPSDSATLLNCKAEISIMLPLVPSGLRSPSRPLSLWDLYFRNNAKHDELLKAYIASRVLM